jgi:hypothetical protein
MGTGSCIFGSCGTQVLPWFFALAGGCGARGPLDDAYTSGDGAGGVLNAGGGASSVAGQTGAGVTGEAGRVGTGGGNSVGSSGRAGSDGGVDDQSIQRLCEDYCRATLPSCGPPQGSPSSDRVARCVPDCVVGLDAPSRCSATVRTATRCIADALLAAGPVTCARRTQLIADECGIALGAIDCS